MNHIIVKDAIGKVEWENFLLNVKQPPFLQSWNMKTLHDHISEQSFQIGIYDNGHLVGVALTILVKAKRGCYLYLPYGPVFTNWKSEYFQALTTFLTQKAKELRVDFIRSSPFIENNNTHQQIYSTHGWKKAPIHMLAEHIWWLDIDKSEDELLKGMRKTMRNLIRRAGKEGVTIEISKNPNDVDIFINIHKDTVQRHGFVPYKNGYFRAQVNAFIQDNQVEIFLAKYHGKIISAAIIMYYGNLASYHHGASLSKFYKIPASYLLQWQAIKRAQELGYAKYNFWGIVPEDKMISPILKRKHPFAGVTTFKTGFGGQEFDLLPCQDLKISNKYHITRVIETVRRIRRGFW